MRLFNRPGRGLDEQTTTILRNLASRDGARRATALAQLDEMPPDEAVRILLFILNRDQRTRRSFPIMAGASFGGVWLMNVALSRGGLRSFVGSPFQIAIQGIVMGLVASNRLRAGSYRALVAYQDPRVVDALVTAMTSGPAETRRPAQMALTGLLPKLRPADSLHVSRASRHRLNDLLVNSVRTDFVLAILAAWEQVGDEEAIPPVERLASGEGAAGHDLRVREAATVALPIIREAAKRTAISGVLLRPADSSDPAPDLLRPAATAESEDQHVLLRPSVE